MANDTERKLLASELPLEGTHGRGSLLERAWDLHRVHDLPGLIELLSPLSESDLAAEPELGLMLGFAWHHTGHSSRALRVVQALQDPLRREGNTKLSRRVHNLHAMVLLEQGNLQAAEELWLDLHERAGQAGDPLTLAWVNSNLAIVADIQCRWEDALASSQRAHAAYQRLGDHNALGGTHHNIGMTYRQLGILDDAVRNFERAAGYYRIDGNQNDIARTELERGLTIYMLGDVRLARAGVHLALERFTALGHRAGQSDSWRVLAIFARQERRFDEARRLLKAGLPLVRDAGDKLTEAEILEELAVLEKQEGNSGESARHAVEAARIYRGMGADRRAERMEERLSGTTTA